jgi:hypothetical protein
MFSGWWRDEEDRGPLILPSPEGARYRYEDLRSRGLRGDRVL